MKYSDYQKGCNIKIGDKVRIVRKPSPSEMTIWNNYWNELMDSTIGMTGEVKNIDHRGIYIDTNSLNAPADQGHCWVYPYFSLAIR